MDKFICFVHIEKCAGTTMHHILHQNFKTYFALSPDRIDYPDMSPGQLQKFVRSIKLDVKGIGGHMVVPYANYEQVIKKSIFYFSFLRQPEERYISFLNHRINRMKFNWNLEDFLTMKGYHNLQTKKFAGEVNLQKAIDIIETKVGFVGFMKLFDEGLILLKDKLKLDNFNLKYEKSNVLIAPKLEYKFSKLQPQLQEQVLQCNSVDTQLYNYVEKHIYPRYKADYAGILLDDLDMHREINKNYQFSKLRLNIDRAKNFAIRKLIFKKKIFH